MKNSSPFSFVGRWEYAAMSLGLGGALSVLAGAVPMIGLLDLGCVIVVRGDFCCLTCPLPEEGGAMVSRLPLARCGTESWKRT